MGEVTLILQEAALGSNLHSSTYQLLSLFFISLSLIITIITLLPYYLITLSLPYHSPWI